jgi:hypothetical protein
MGDGFCRLGDDSRGEEDAAVSGSLTSLAIVYRKRRTALVDEHLREEQRGLSLDLRA